MSFIQQIDISCGNCRHFFDPKSEYKEDLCHCFRFPPQVIYIKDSNGDKLDIRSINPEVDTDDCCGEWEHNKDVLFRVFNMFWVKEKGNVHI